MFQQSKLASAVALGLGVTIGTVGGANAATVFFPVVVESAANTTIVSVINTSDALFTSNGAYFTAKYPDTTGFLHYIAYYKRGTDANNLTAPCEEYNTYNPTSPYDIQTIDLGAVFGSTTLGVLFNDPSINNQWQQANRDYALFRGLQPARGYLVVANNDSSSSSRSLTGEAFVLDYTVGAVWGYQAYTGVGPNEPTGAFDFYSANQAGTANPSTVMVQPPAGITGGTGDTTTALYVTPVAPNLNYYNPNTGAPAASTASGAAQLPDGVLGLNGQAPDGGNIYEATVAFGTVGATPTSWLSRAYDRDEGVTSGTHPVKVVCTARVNVLQFFNQAFSNNFENGGYGQVISSRTSAKVPFNPSTALAEHLGGAAITKLEYNLTGTFQGVSIGGVYNNGVMLRPYIVPVGVTGGQ